MNAPGNFWLGEFNSSDFERLNYGPPLLDELEDEKGNVIIPHYFYLDIEEVKNEKFCGFTRDILGHAKIEGYLKKVSPHLQVVLFTQEYLSKARKNGATSNVLVLRAVLTSARLKLSEERQELATGIRTGRNENSRYPSTEAFIMRKIY
ncbi:MAG: hypothetical protein AABX17_02240 [Nanoarchaeota archaeon]